MKRILATAKFIDVPKNLSSDLLVLTPNPTAAAHLNIPHQSLRSVAREILNRENIGVASPLRSLHVLRSVAAQIAPDRDPRAEAARLRPILDGVLRYGIDILAMKRSGVRSAQDLAQAVDIYCTELLRQGLVDQESVLWKAIEIIKERQAVLVYGYFRARASDVRFIDKLAGDGSIYIVPSGNESIFTSANRSIEWLVEQGWERKPFNECEALDPTLIAQRFAAGLGKSTVGTECSAFAYSNVDAEVRATLAAAKKMIVGGADPSSIAIVCRTATDYEQTISTIASEYGISVSMPSKIALVETKLGNYIRLLFETVESDLEFAVTARLLKHPYGMQLSDESFCLARRRRASGAKAWKCAAVDLEGFKAPSDQFLKDWIKWLVNIIPPKLVRERSAENAAELLSYESFRDALKEMTAFEDGRAMDLAAFSDSVLDVLETFTTPTHPGTGGIPFHQPNTIIGGQFDHVFVLGMVEGMMPATTNQDAVVDFHEQRELEEKGVMFDRPVEFPRWEALSFYYVLLAAKKSITLSYPKAIDIEEKLPSLFFDRLGIVPVNAKPVSISSSREEMKVFLRLGTEESTETFAAARHQFEVERRRESALPYDEYDGVIGIPIRPESRVWSASQLTKIGQCPFKWFSEKVLKLSAVDEADTDLRSSVMGRLYHKTLQLAVERAILAENFRTGVLDELEPAFREAEADEEIAVSELPNWEHRRSEHLITLKKAVESPDFIAEGSRVIATEKSFDANWNGFAMRGTIDRVDETPEGFIAIDYKTGVYVGKVKGTSGELESDIQLPIYSKVALESMFPGQVADGHYFSLKQTKIIKQRSADLDSFAIGVRRILETGDFAVDPDGLRKSCKYCEYDAVCRRGQRNARKQRS